MVTEKSYGRKTENFHFFRKIFFARTFFSDLLEPQTFFQSLFWSVLPIITGFQAVPARKKTRFGQKCQFFRKN